MLEGDFHHVVTSMFLEVRRALATIEIMARDHMALPVAATYHFRHSVGRQNSPRSTAVGCAQLEISGPAYVHLSLPQPAYITDLRVS